MSPYLAERIDQLPSKPGVYQYFDATGTLLYVGKAKDLKKRVSSYWHNKGQSPWTRLLVSEVADIKVTEVNSELEAFMLENSFIKSLKPKYNIQLKDDKTFPFLRVSNDPFPVFSIVRRVKKDRARYLGPFLSATYIRTMLKIMQELYGIQTVSQQSYEARSSVPNQIGLGARNLDNQELYNQNVEAAIKFLSEPQPKIEKLMKIQMREASESESFERAASLRDKLIALQQLRSTQSLFSPTSEVRDYIGVAQQGKLIVVYVLHEREGKITDRNDYTFESPVALSESERSEFLISYLYTNGLSIPKKIVISVAPNEQANLETFLREQNNTKVEILVPQRGDTKERLATANDNAAYEMKLQLTKKSRREQGIHDLAQLLHLPSLPRRIEACDISNLGATSIVGATIVFIDGKPAKNEYRKYNINTPEGQDDFASMREMVYRRLTQKERELPDLLLIDGGKGQLGAAMDAQALAKTNVPLVSLAKKEELLFLPNQTDPIALTHDSDALLLLTAIRDEVHRFVITFHRKKRSQKFIP